MRELTWSWLEDRLLLLLDLDVRARLEVEFK
jgi:hypothetical protein